MTVNVSHWVVSGQSAMTTLFWLADVDRIRSATAKSTIRNVRSEGRDCNNQPFVQPVRQCQLRANCGRAKHLFIC